MQSAMLNPMPTWGAVAREQFRSVGLALRREGVAAAGLMTLVTVWTAFQQAQPYHDVGVPFSPSVGMPASVLALLVPMAVWKGEDPGRRGYHRAMPVSHAAHAVMRSLSGLAWMLAGVAAYFSWLWALSAATGGSAGFYKPYLWVVPFVAATVMYLFGSALTLATTHPWRWLGGTVVGYMFLNALRSPHGSRSIADSVNLVMEGRFGLFTMISGWSPSPVRHYLQVDNASVWLAATWLWLAIAVVAFAFAAFRQPER
jgi:hypothetical protein